MAFDKARLECTYSGGGVAGISYYHYVTDGTDTVGTVEESGFMNNADDDLNLRVGDEIKITVPGTQTDVSQELKEIADVGKVIVMSVSSAGVVDTSADIDATTLTYT